MNKIILILLLIANSVFSQNIFKAKVLLDSVVSKYGTANSYKSKFNIEIKTLSNNDLIEKKSCLNIKYGNSRYQKLGDMVSVLTSEFLVIIDHDQKTFYYGFEPAGDDKEYNDYDVLSTLNYFQNNGHESYSENEYQYVLKLKSNNGVSIPFSIVEMYINKSTYLLDKQVLVYNSFVESDTNEFDHPVLEIKYGQFDPELSSKDKKLFKKELYFKNRLGRWIPNLIYDNYTIQQLF